MGKRFVLTIVFGAAAAAAQEFQLVRHTVDSGGVILQDFAEGQNGFSSS